VAEEAGVVEASATGRDEEAVRRFIERFALNLVEAGMARMPARVFAGVLVAEDGRQTAAELAELLQVSPAAISPADWRSGSPLGRWCLGVEACRAVKRER
jgi:hypothetical protein